MTRVWHPWYKWEDYTYNFYGGATNEYAKQVGLYAALLRDLPRFESALKTIINEWPHSCEHNLSNEAMNRVAYLGQAACALVYKVPHTASMSEYNLLTAEEQRAADAMAQKYLDLWAAKQEQSNVAA